MAGKADYLKRYLGGGSAAGAAADAVEGKKKRRKVAPVAGAGGIRMVDDDVDDWRHPRPEGQHWSSQPGGQLGDEEDAPVVANAFGDAAAQGGGGRSGVTDGSGWVELPAPDAGGDLSPPRRGRHDSSPEASPGRQRPGVRGGSRDSDGDLSPPRRNGAAARGVPQPGDDGDLSPPRRGRRHDSDAEEEDLSPPRRHAPVVDADLSPPRRPAGGQHSDSDLSRPRQPAGEGVGGDGDGDLSPPRRPGGPGPVMLDGSRAGLLSASHVTAEAQAKKAAEAARVAAMTADQSGRGAGTVYRDAQGRAVSLEELTRQRSEVNKKPEPVRPEWGTGIAQQRAAAEAARQLASEAKAPFARYADDAALNADAKRRSRWGDPLAGVMTSAAGKADEEAMPPPPPLGGAFGAAILARGGFRIPQEVPLHSWVRRKIGAPPNRYGIAPGRHWDGVDRSNGFEEKLFKAKNEAATKERDAFLWSSSQYE